MFALLSKMNSEDDEILENMKYLIIKKFFAKTYFMMI